MESSNSQGGPAPFLIKTYEMVEDPSTNRVVSWGPGGTSFIVWNPPDFSRDLLPKYFKHNNFSSFIRQLNTYGFRKVDPERWEFANEEFIRGHMHLLKNIHRRKPVHSHSLQNQVNGPLADSERHEFEDEISRLKQEKSVLLADLQRQAQQQAGITWLMQSLEERLAAMEQRQQGVVAYVRDILQRKRDDVSGSALAETDHFSDHFSKKRRVPKIDFFAEEPVAEEQQVPYPHTTGATPPGMFPVRTVNAEPFEKMELALASLENLIQRAGDYASPEDMYSSVASPALALGDLQTASMENSIISLQPSGSLEPSSPPGLLESPGYVQSPMLQLADIHQDTSKRTTEIDLDSEGSTTDTSQDEMMTAETGASHESEQAVVNDLFWGRFLTETPELYRTRFDADCKTEATKPKDDVAIGIDCSWFKNRGHVEQITQQMEHLASGEKT